MCVSSAVIRGLVKWDTLSSQAHQSRHKAGAQLWMCSLGSQATDNLFFLMKVTHTLYMKSLKYRKAEIGNKTLSPTTEVLSRLPLCIIKKHGFLYACLNT